MVPKIPAALVRTPCKYPLLKCAVPVNGADAALIRYHYMANGAGIVTPVIMLSYVRLHCRTGKGLEIRETYSY